MYCLFTVLSRLRVLLKKTFKVCMYASMHMRKVRRSGGVQQGEGARCYLRLLLYMYLRQSPPPTYIWILSASGIIDDSIILATTGILIFNLNFQSLYCVVQLLIHDECNA